MPTDQAMGWMLAATMVSSAAIALGTGAAAQLVLPLTSGQALAIAAVAGLFGAGIPSLFFLTGIRTIGGTRTGILMLFEPLGGVLLAALLLDERLQPIQAVGGAAILGAALLLQRSAADVEPAPAMQAGPGVVPGAER
jgi:drug/metabolite transporter (DMT)-like permease